MPRNGPDPIDIEVGRRVRLHRLARRMSQTKLANEIGVTFQQVQKYEKGVNRIGAGRLSRIAKVLDVPLTAFFGGAVTPKGDQAHGTITELEYLVLPGALRLMNAYKQIEDASMRRTIVNLAEMIVLGRKQTKPSRRS
jgi:transcriptional regulator with XRE-family HTH domain